jgi:hypothetical protein
VPHRPQTTRPTWTPLGPTPLPASSTGADPIEIDDLQGNFRDGMEHPIDVGDADHRLLRAMVSSLVPPSETRESKRAE